MSSISFIQFSEEPSFVYLCVDNIIQEKLKALYPEDSVTINPYDDHFIINVKGSPPPEDDVFMIVDASTSPPPPPPDGGKILLIKTSSSLTDAQISSFLQSLARNIDIITIRKFLDKISEKKGGKKRFNKSTNRRRRSSKKRATQRKQKRRQRRGSRRAY